MNKTIVVSGLLLLATGAAGWAQGAALSETDRSFLIKDASGGAYELASAKLAAAKATSTAIKDYATKLIHDHEAYNAALIKLGKDNGIALPTEPAAADKDRLHRLEQASGAAFDKLYVNEAMRVNKEDKQEAEKEKASTANQSVKDFIARFAAVDAEHEKLANQLEQPKG